MSMFKVASDAHQLRSPNKKPISASAASSPMISSTNNEPAMAGRQIAKGRFFVVSTSI